MARNLMLISSPAPYENGSRIGHLNHCASDIKGMLWGKEKVVFIPYAADPSDWPEDGAFMSSRFRSRESGFSISDALCKDQGDLLSIVGEASAFIVGPGRLPQLWEELQGRDLLTVLKKRVNEGVPYVGIQAGALLAAPTFYKPCTDGPGRNGEEALGAIPFQITVGYGTDRQSAVEALVHGVQDIPPLVALKEGTVLQVRDDTMTVGGMDSPDAVTVFTGSGSNLAREVRHHAYATKAQGSMNSFWE